jgi:hypothetical protein
MLLSAVALSGTALLLPAIAAKPFKELPPWGDSLFGEWEVEGSHYRHSGLNDVRHSGWSWNAIRTNTPFCATMYLEDEEDERPYEISSCTYPTEECANMGGSLFDSICMEDPAKPFTVVGPDCWNKNCSIGGMEETIATCEETLGGTFVAPTLLESAVSGQRVVPVWCLVPG